MLTALDTTAAFQALRSHYADAKNWHLRDLFAQQPTRFNQFSVEAASLFLDYSKNHLNSTTLQLLCNLARERGVEIQRDAMFAGAPINRTEHRAVMHVALRAPRNHSFAVDGHDITQDVHAVLARIEDFTQQVRSGQWVGYTGHRITDIVNIGIGGSELGPEMVCRALRAYAPATDVIKPHFVANVDAHALTTILAKLNPETTLFIVASKTFTTTETMLNAQSARNWFLQHGTQADLAKHFVAVSSNVEAVKTFGIDPDHIFPFWDWVGGRYSIWSAIGLPVALTIGFDHFSAFLAGAHAMDQHFRSAPLEHNMPVLLALVGVWYRNFFASTSLSIAPYHQDLNRFPAYLQQLEMESNGKRVTLDGNVLAVASCPVVWGDVGTNGQHAYFQLLHQGTDIIPVDFITALQPRHALPEHHAVLLANCFAQSEALMRGKTADELRADMQQQGTTSVEIEALIPHRSFPGNRPSNTILMDTLTPHTLGALTALYEHKVFVQGIIWGINSFDQWGVELGKMLAKNIHAELIGVASADAHDSSTNGLIARAKCRLG